MKPFLDRNIGFWWIFYEKYQKCYIGTFCRSTRPLYGHNSVELIDQHPGDGRVGVPSTNSGKDDTAGNIDLDKLIQ